MKVGVTDHVFSDLSVERALLEPLGVKLELASATDEATLIDLAGGASALLVCYAPVQRPVIETAAKAGVKVIARYGIGYDNIDVEAATEYGIVVTNVPDYCLDEVADQTILLLLAVARSLLPALDTVRSGEWSFPRGVHRVQGRRLALLGMGRVGRKVADRALAFGLEVIVHDPFLQSVDPPVQRAVTLEEALAEADFVSLHAPLGPDTQHLICDETIAWMHRAPVLINTSRGGLVDLDAVVGALDDGRLSGVGLDVTEPEPLPARHPLRTHPKALVTAHMAFYSVEAERELQRRAAEEVARGLRGEPPRCPVNPQVLTTAAR
jgi:D-3-phosphoglycerate dehydrogenase / 2-oxoglutarate reductase